MSEAIRKTWQRHPITFYNFNIPTETAAWMAGFLEGEGSIYISRAGSKNRGFWLRGYVTIYNTEREAMDTFKEYVGGCLWLKRAAGGYTGNDLEAKKNYYAWSISGFKAYFFCKAVLPHMRTSKRIKAEELIHFYEERYPALKGAN